MRQTLLGLPKSIAGAGLAAVGEFILYGNLAAAGGQAVGVVAVATAILATAGVMHANASGHQRFVAIFLQHVLL